MECFEHQPIGRLIAKTALPTVVAMLSAWVYQLADLLFYGQGAAVIGVATPIFSFMQAVGYTVALGGSTLFSVCLGKQQQAQSHQLARATLWFELWVGLLMGVVGTVCAPWLVAWLANEYHQTQLVVAYVRSYLLSAPFWCLGYGFSCLLRGGGQATGAMWGMITGGLVKLLATFVLIHYTPLGLVGGGLATVLGQGVSVGILFAMYRKHYKRHKTNHSIQKIGGKAYWQIFRMGISSLFRQGTVSLSTVVSNQAALRWGDSTLVSLTVAGRICGLIYSAFLGWGQGYQSVASYFYGKNNSQSIHRSFWFSVITGTIAMGVLGGLCWWLAPWLVTRLGATGESLTQGVGCLRWQSAALVLIPFSVLTNMTFQSTKRPIGATLLACCRQGFCLLPVIWLSAKWYGVNGLLASQGIADILTFICSLVPCIWLLNKKIR